MGMVVAGATANLVPADQKLYALRDVTATVACLPLIASSIMSKKLAVQTDSLVIDVKVGDGAFFPIPEQAREFARVAGAIGRVFGRRVSFVLTDMDQPLGEAIGNALEVREAIETLKGGGPAALMEVCAALAAQVLADAGFSEGIAGLVTETIRDGRALEVFERWISAQGGDARIVDDPARLPQAKHQIRVRAPHGGTIDSLRARQLGELAEKLGAGRTRKEDTIDPAAGILLRIKAPCVVNAGDDLAVLHTDSEPRDEWRELFLAAVHWTSDSPTRRATVLDVIRT
ncbi:MAG: thymidine phosphorylase [Chloroflexi bacterium]|nr:MAG: thymidine phosphorylase [Chloroflexota bacterium]